MFEKEAIIHAFEATKGIECLNKPIEDFTYEELSDEQQEKAYDFKKGAEFGYNKAFVEADKNLKAIVTDFNKANEWHRVSDKLPEMDVLVYLWKKGKDFPVVACRHFPYGKKEWVWNCEWGSGFTISQLKGRDFLWKEIVLPKEIKEKCLD